jgi:hypothetical protein
MHQTKRFSARLSLHFGRPNKIHTLDAVSLFTVAPTMTGVLPLFSPLVMEGLAQGF